MAYSDWITSARSCKHFDWSNNKKRHICLGCGLAMGRLYFRCVRFLMKCLLNSCYASVCTHGTRTPLNRFSYFILESLITICRHIHISHDALHVFYRRIRTKHIRNKSCRKKKPNGSFISSALFP